MTVVVVLLIKNVVPIMPDTEIGNSSSLLLAISLLHLTMCFIFQAKFWKSGIKNIGAAANHKVSNGVDGETAQEHVKTLRTVSGSNVISKPDKEHVV